MTSRQPCSTPADRKRELKRERQRRWRAGVAARRTTALVKIDENGLQALVDAGLLPEHAAHLREAIKQSTQAAFDLFVVSQLNKSRFP